MEKDLYGIKPSNEISDKIAASIRQRRDGVVYHVEARHEGYAERDFESVGVSMVIIRTQMFATGAAELCSLA